MAWTDLPTDYTDATWTGDRKYIMINNDDGTVSFKDVTAYTNKEKSFFGAKDANAMNSAINGLMSTSDSPFAPKNHADGATTYGKATSGLYGHTKLSDSVSSTLSAASGGTAATPSAVKKVYDLLGGAKIITGSSEIAYGTQMKFIDISFGYTFKSPPFVIAMQVFNGAIVACTVGQTTVSGCRFSVEGSFTSTGSREFQWLAIGV